MAQPEVWELRSARYLAAEALRGVLRPGDAAVDATVGNGHDTCMLAELVGPEGHVTGFDIQPEAIARTEALLRERGLWARCELHGDGHQHMAEHVTGPVRAVCFNLGWLPGGDKRVTTRWETTRAALEQALGLLEPMGVCTVCAYPGHEAGREELEQLVAFFTALRPQEYNVLRQTFLNAGPGAPECFVVQRQRKP